MTCILQFHSSSDRYFGSDMSSDGLKVLATCLLSGKVGLVTMIGHQKVVMGATNFNPTRHVF